MQKKIFNTIVCILILSFTLSLIGMFKITNVLSEEQVWDYHNDLLYGGAVYQLASDSLAGNWICTVNKTSLYYSKVGIGQEYWERIPLPQANTYIQYIYPYGTSILLVADQGMYIRRGIYTEETQWEEIVFPKIIKTVEIITTQLPGVGNIYWLATNNGLYYSKDPIQNDDSLFHWSLTDFPVSVEIKDLWFDPQTNIFYVLSADGWIYICKNLNNINNLNWDRINLDKQIHTVQQFITTQNPQKTWLVSTQSQGIYTSENEGITWNNISKELPNLYISQMKLIQNDIFASTYGGLFVYHLEKGEWSKVGDPLFNEQINCFELDKNSLNIMIGTNGNGIWNTQYNQEESLWKKNDLKIEGILVKKILKNYQETKILLSTWGAGIYLSNNNGLSWKQSNQGLTNPYILSLYYESDESVWAGTLNGGLFFSNDFGATWNRTKSSTLLSQYFYSVLVDRNNSKVVYAGTDRAIFKSVNRGDSWNQLYLGSEDHPVGSITALEQDSISSEILYAGTDSSGVYISKDSGESWFPSNNGFPFRSINCLTSIPHRNNVLLAGTNGDGCYISLNQGDSWEKLKGLRENALVYEIISPKDKDYTDECFISTEEGLYRLNLITREFTDIGKGVFYGIRSSMVFQKKIWIGTYGKGVASLITLPKPPMPMDPTNLSQTTKTRIMFRWSETSFSEYPVLYRVQISLNKEFFGIFHESGTISGDQWLIPENTLKRHTTYYWRVRGETSIGNTIWSKPYEFTIVTIIQMKINQPQLQINGETKNLDNDPRVVPIIKDSRTFLPIRVIIEAWQGNIDWNNNLKQVTIKVDQNTIVLTIQKAEALVNGILKKIDENKHVVPFILNGRTMLPLRFISENLHSQVEWDASTQNITLVYPGRSP